MDYDKAIVLEPTFGEPYYNKAMAYRRKGQHMRAIEYFGQAILLMPDSGITRYDRGVSHRSLGNDAEAENDLAKALELGFAPDTGG